jgi:hypothetical protein
MTAQDIKILPAAEKIRIMEAIWARNISAICMRHFLQTRFQASKEKKNWKLREASGFDCQAGSCGMRIAAPRRKTRHQTQSKKRGLPASAKTSGRERTFGQENHS